MTIEALGIIDSALTGAGINYEYEEWTSSKIYPYWVGEYSEVEPLDEEGMSESTFILTGFTTGNVISLEQNKNTIRQLFDEISGYIATTDSGSVVAIFYGNAVKNPVDNGAIKSMTIYLRIKEWRVN